MKWGFVYLLLVNIAAFAAMKSDKRRAQAGLWRISEKTLLLLAVLGGSIGAIAGMRLCHHKTKHKKFVVGLPFVLLLQCALILWLCKYIVR